MAFIGRVNDLPIEGERVLVAGGIDIDEIANIVKNNFSNGQAVEIQFINTLPVPKKNDDRLLESVVDMFNIKVNELNIKKRKWHESIAYMTVNMNDLIIRFLFIENAVNGLEDNILTIFEQIIPKNYEPLIFWEFSDIRIYKYTHEGVERVVDRYN